MFPHLHRAAAFLAVLLALPAPRAPGAQPAPGAPRAAGAPSQEPREAVLVVDLLDNGSGEEENAAPAGDARALSVPWWIASGAPRTQPNPRGVLAIPAGGVLAQPVAAYAPLAAGVVLRGKVAGAGRVRLVDGRGDALALDVRDQAFELRAEEFASRFGRAPRPRFVVELSASTAAGAWFSDLHALVPLPAPSEQALAAELRALCGQVFATWLERAIDKDGPRPTTFLTGKFDAVTGERLGVDASGIHPLYECLLEATAACDVPEWNASLAAFLEDFLAHAFHPDTGLPREWDGVLDLPQDGKPVEIARYLAFLLDVEEAGPPAYRERALAGAARIGATVLARGRLGDGSIAVKYTPADAAPSLAAPPIRKLDVAAQLARLGRRLGDEEMVAAATAALAELEWTHFWGGSWDRIDPDFDDSYGNWGSKATTMLQAAPGDALLARFTARGFAHFAPLWRDAARFGGSMAADQTRCWEFLLRYAELEVSARPALDRVLQGAVRAHFKGEQYDTGAWGDVTFAGFAPRATLNVGDFSGTPANLLQGLAFAYRRGSALRGEETRALFTAVLRSSREVYGRPFGWLSTREEQAGHNLAFGELRMAVGAAEMLSALRP